MKLKNKLIFAFLITIPLFSFGQIETGINLIGGVADKIKNASLTKDLRKAQKLFSLGKYEYLNIQGDLTVEIQNLKKFQKHLQRNANKMIKTLSELNKKEALGNIEPQTDIKDVEISISNTSESILHVLRGDNKIIISTGFIAQIMALSYLDSQEMNEIMKSGEPLSESGIERKMEEIMTGFLDRMIMKMNFTSSAITFSDAINFSISHEIIHLIFDDRTLGPSKKNELRADALGFIVMAENSPSVKRQVKFHKKFKKSYGAGAIGINNVALMFSQNGAEFLFRVMDEFGEGRDEFHPTIEESLTHAESTMESFIEYSIDNKKEDLYEVIDQQLKLNNDED